MLHLGRSWSRWGGPGRVWGPLDALVPQAAEVGNRRSAVCAAAAAGAVVWACPWRLGRPRARILDRALAERRWSCAARAGPRRARPQRLLRDLRNRPSARHFADIGA